MRTWAKILVFLTCLSVIVSGSLPPAQRVAAAERAGYLLDLATAHARAQQVQPASDEAPDSPARQLVAQLHKLQDSLGAEHNLVGADLADTATEICALSVATLHAFESGLLQAEARSSAGVTAARSDHERLQDALNRFCATLQQAARSKDKIPAVKAQLAALLAEPEPEVTALRFQQSQPPDRPMRQIRPQDATLFDQLEALAPPATADLAESMEVQLTGAIRDLAAELDHNPARIADFVHNQLKYEPYQGSLRGAQETLWEGRGNDVDLSSLTIALLRASNVPARYVSGVVEIPIAAATNWLAMRDPERALDMLNEWDLLDAVVGAPPTAVHVRVVWVRTYVDGGWHSIVPWYKQYTFPDRPDLFAHTDLAVPDALESLMDGAVITTTGVITAFTHADTAAATELAQKVYDQTRAFLECCLQDEQRASMEALLGEPEIVPAENQLGVEPFTQVSVEAEFSEVPDALRHQLKITVADSQRTFALPELVGRRLVHGYLPATESDWELVESFGSIYDIPSPQTLQLAPLLYLDDVELARGEAVSLASLQDVEIVYNAPGREPREVQRRVVAGSWHVFAIDPGHTSIELVMEQVARLESMYEAAQANPEAVPIQDAVGQILQFSAASFFAQMGRTGQLAAAAQDATLVRGAGFGVFSANLKVTRVFVVPVAVDFGGLGMDINLVTANLYNRDGEREAERGAFLSWGAQASTFEHTTYELLYGGNGVSTTRLLHEASRQGIPIYIITRANLDESLNELDLSSTFRNVIREQVRDQDATVIVPQRNIAYGGFEGIGWVALSPDGVGGYFLGGTRGGALTDAALDYINGVIGLLLELVPGALGNLLSLVNMALALLFAQYRGALDELAVAFAAWGVLLFLIGLVMGPLKAYLLLASFIIGVLIPVAIQMWMWFVQDAFRQLRALIDELLRQWPRRIRMAALPAHWEDHFADDRRLRVLDGVQLESGRLFLGRWQLKDRGAPFADFPGLHTLLAAPDGMVYAGAGDGHLLRIHQLDGELMAEDLGKVRPASNRITALSWGSDGQLYLGLGTSGARLARFNPGDGTFAEVFVPPNPEERVQRAVSGLVEVNGRIFGGTTFGGVLFWYRPDNEEGGALAPALPGFEHITALAAVDDQLYGAVAGGPTQTAHLFHFDPATDQVTDLGAPMADEAQITALVRGADGHLYGGTSPNGVLFRFDPNTGQGTEVARLGANDTAISALTLDDAGRIAGGTFPRGALFVFDPADSGLTILGSAAQQNGISALIHWNGKVLGAAHAQGRLVALEYGPHASSGSALSAPIRASRVTSWDRLMFTSERPAGTELDVDVLDPCRGDLLLTAPSDVTSLDAIAPGLCPALQLRVRMSGAAENSPTLHDWAVHWRAAPSQQLYMPLVHN